MKQMNRRCLTSFLVLHAIVLPAVGQSQGYDDSKMRREAADRIQRQHNIAIDWEATPLHEICDVESRLNTSARLKDNHNIAVDWREHSLAELLDAEARLNTAQRIKRNHGVTFDWRKVTLAELLDAESRMNTARRIGQATNTSVDWKKHSLKTLMWRESQLRSDRARQHELSLRFDALFPPATRQGMGIHRLDEQERQALLQHVESLLAAQSRQNLQPLESRPVRVQPLPEQARTVSAIETTIDGEFEGWEGETIVKLTNGQIWQQSEYYYEYSYSYMADVLIYPSGGTWKMKVEDIDEAVEVQRLK